MQKFFDKINFLRSVRWGRGGKIKKEKKGSHDMASSNTRSWSLASKSEQNRRPGKK